MQFDVASHATASVRNHPFGDIHAVDSLKVPGYVTSQSSRSTPNLQATLRKQPIPSPAFGQLLPITAASFVEVGVCPRIGTVGLASGQWDHAKQWILLAPGLPFQVGVIVRRTLMTRVRSSHL